LFDLRLKQGIGREGNVDVTVLVRRKEKFRKGHEDDDDWEV
jgi:hypothetical protein